MAVWCLGAVFCLRTTDKYQQQTKQRNISPFQKRKEEVVFHIARNKQPKQRERQNDFQQKQENEN